MSLSKSISFVLLIAFCIAGFAQAASASEIHGTVVNRTTGSSDIEVDVSIINPATGMTPQKSVKAVAGAFAVTGLAPAVYMARVDYKGVTYNQQFEIANADDHVDITVDVYEPTTSWDGVRVFVPHFTAERHDDHLVIERVYDIYNESDPPRTITGDDGYFRFPLPAEMHNFNGMMVQYGDVPIERQPSETGEDGVLRVDYPIRPGVTRVVLSYTAEYASGSVAMSEKIQYDIESFTVYATDTEMTITSSSHDLAAGEGPHASVSKVITNLKKGDVLSLGFSGGAAQRASAGGAQSTVLVVPNDAENLSVLLMIILALALVAFVGIAGAPPEGTPGGSGDATGQTGRPARNRRDSRRRLPVEAPRDQESDRVAHVPFEPLIGRGSPFQGR
jgi:hypothetical protein